ncbi:MAG: ABC transporter ATP-binding protein [Burkholderiaceae bacterium]
MLSVQSVNKQFGGLRALNNVSLDVAVNEIHGVMGANGAGKTTLFSIIAGHQRPDTGRIVFDGKEIQGLRPDQVCRRGIARSFQIVRPFPNMTVRENVETAVQFGRFSVDKGVNSGVDNGAENSSKPIAPAERTDSILEATELADLADKPARVLTLSGRKRLELARALGSGPRLLLLDEIMAGLTASEVRKMTETIQQVRHANGLTILIIEHVVSALSDLSDTITVLHHGERIAQGAPKEIADDAVVQAVYFGEEAT